MAGTSSNVKTGSTRAKPAKLDNAKTQNLPGKAAVKDYLKINTDDVSQSNAHLEDQDLNEILKEQRQRLNDLQQ